MPELSPLFSYMGVMCAAILMLLIAVSALLIVLLKRQRAQQQAAAGERAKLYDAQEKNAREMRDCLNSFMTREEITAQFFGTADGLRAHISDMSRGELSRFDAFDARFEAFSTAQESRIRALSALLDEKLLQSEARIERMRETLEKSVGNLQAENSKKLEEMRQTVDEKLHTTLEKRLTESFGQVTKQLDLVSQGLGEMRTLASGVGDLKKVLTNVKTRGVWGEMQLGTLLAQVLSNNQYDENVAVTPGSTQRVEFAIKLPGQGEGTVYLPIDAKFPMEDYERLIEAGENGDAAQIQAAQQALQNALKTEAKRISQKYIDPPHTTDFAIMFLPTEGLYAEALRARGLVQELQEKLRIVITGPSTLTALLSSLQIGFRTLAIEKSSAQVWTLLSAVKTDFSRFTDLLDTAQKRMRSASDSIEKATSRSRTITRKLKNVENMDADEATAYLETENTLPELPDPDDLDG